MELRFTTTGCGPLVRALAGVGVTRTGPATAGCAAVHLFGQAARYPEFLYVFIAWFIGGGVVINGNLFPGRSGYAGSLGQIPDAIGRDEVTEGSYRTPRSRSPQ